MRLFTFILILLTFYPLIFSQDYIIENKCIVTGNIVGIKCKSIILARIDEDHRTGEIQIPVKNGAFKSDIGIKYPEGFSVYLITKDDHIILTNLVLFLELDENKVLIKKTGNRYECEIQNNALDREYKKYMKNLNSNSKLVEKKLSDSLNSIVKNINKCNDSINSIYKEFMKDSSSTDLSKFYLKTKHLRTDKKKFERKERLIKEQLAVSNDSISLWKLNYFKNNPSLISYFFFYKELGWQKKLTHNQINPTYLYLSKKYPAHPYSQLVKLIVDSKKNIKTGNRVIDFSAPDLNDNLINLSKFIQGKFVLIDFWARWCGSCIYKSRSMLPIYEKYKSKGFSVLGVINENQDMLYARNLLEREKYPWKVLVEFKNQNKIWEKYGMQGSAGMMLLTDKNGIILKVNPTAEEVESILRNLL